MAQVVFQLFADTQTDRHTKKKQHIASTYRNFLGGVFLVSCLLMILLQCSKYHNPRHCDENAAI